VGAELLGSRLHAALFGGLTSNRGRAAITLRRRPLAFDACTLGIARGTRCDRHHTNVLAGGVSQRNLRQHLWLSEFSVDREKFFSL
jgi:hypothetical protein